MNENIIPNLPPSQKLKTEKCVFTEIKKKRGGGMKVSHEKLFSKTVMEIRVERHTRVLMELRLDSQRGSRALVL